MCQITHTLCDDCATISITHKAPCLAPASATCEIEWIFDPTEPENCPECAEKASRMEQAEKTEKAQQTSKTEKSKKMTKVEKAKLARLQKLVDKMDERTLEAVRRMLDEKLKGDGKEEMEMETEED